MTEEKTAKTASSSQQHDAETPEIEETENVSDEASRRDHDKAKEKSEGQNPPLGSSSARANDLREADTETFAGSTREKKETEERGAGENGHGLGIDGPGEGYIQTEGEGILRGDSPYPKRKRAWNLQRQL